MRATSGFAKIIVSDDDTQKILGMRAAGPQVSSTIMSIALLIDQDKNAMDALGTMFPHPTMSEVIQECLRLLSGKSLYRPEAFSRTLENTPLAAGGWFYLLTWKPGRRPPST